MKYAVSNIALPAYDHAHEFHAIKDMGLDGLEVAPSRVWQDTWKELSTSQVTAYRNLVEAAGLQVVGLHSLFFDHPDLGLFKDLEGRADTLKFLTHLSEVCRDLGGKTLIYGGGRKRGGLPIEDAYTETESFFSDLVPMIEDHGTCLCFEPLGPESSDFINSVNDSIRLVKKFNHTSLRVQLDAKALVENNELNLSSFIAAKPYLVHFHANEPGLGVLGSTGEMNHEMLGKYLKEIGYKKFVSIEQRMINNVQFMADIKQSFHVLSKFYRSE